MLARTFLRYRLRTLMIGVLALCVLLTWFANRPWRHYLAVKKTESLGGRVEYADANESWLAHSWPALFGRVSGVHLGGIYVSPDFAEFDNISTGATDENVAEVMAAFPHVTRLTLDYTLVTDDVVEILSPCDRLRWVSLSGTKVTHQGICASGLVCRIAMSISAKDKLR